MSAPSREQLHAIATTIQGVMDNLALLPASELPADVALAYLETRVALEDRRRALQQEQARKKAQRHHP
ncbi:MAG: hypothetical protein L6Q98_17745 [Anaerolineae bacterium]|nr:hypothetical protein [Anaerolineae bacterium]NUQ05949.1 hypothetical protein [Anaerolineae bacterium]